MAKLSIYSKKEINQDFNIKRKPQNNLRYPEGSLKFFSNLLKDIKASGEDKNLVITPLLHEENILFKRYQKLSQKERRRKDSGESEYENLMDVIH